MHRLVRNIHLCAGLFSLPAVLMYGVSSIAIAHPDWFALEATVTDRSVAIPSDRAKDARLAARYLMDEHGFRGEVMNVEAVEDGYRFVIRRLGADVEVKYSSAERLARLEIRTEPWMSLLIALHHVHGVRMNYGWIQNVVGVLVAAVSVALIVLAVSGIYLWFKIHEERRIGAALLCASLAYSLTLMILLRLA